ncbi:MAG: hypothetical protein KatS3mg033_1733 [Thermonema sp.]|nr:MAG: hypothetical protein KatS3mg033_1733 [Thermonema sp.]
MQQTSLFKPSRLFGYFRTGRSLSFRTPRFLSSRTSAASERSHQAKLQEAKRDFSLTLEMTKGALKMTQGEPRQCEAWLVIPNGAQRSMLSLTSRNLSSRTSAASERSHQAKLQEAKRDFSLTLEMTKGALKMTQGAPRQCEAWLVIPNGAQRSMLSLTPRFLSSRTSAASERSHQSKPQEAKRDFSLTLEMTRREVEMTKGGGEITKGNRSDKGEPE